MNKSNINYILVKKKRKEIKKIIKNTEDMTKKQNKIRRAFLTHNPKA